MESEPHSRRNVNGCDGLQGEEIREIPRLRRTSGCARQKTNRYACQTAAQNEWMWGGFD